MKYTLTRTVKPTADVVTMTEAHAQLRVDTFGSPPVSPEDTKIASLLTAIVESLDAGTGWLGRALAPQTWKLGLCDFPATSWVPIRLPFPPFIEVVSVEYTQTDGTLVTLVQDTDFRVLVADGQAVLVPPYNGAWPTDARDDYDSVRITFRCGYVEGSPEVAAVPEQIKNYILASLTDQFDSRGVDAPGVSSKITAAVENSMNSLRVYWP